jgi:hypothetical protein
MRENKSGLEKAIDWMDKYREWCKENCCGLEMRNHFKKLLAEEQAQKKQATAKIIGDIKMVNGHGDATTVLIEESIAELADRKGKHIRGISHEPTIWWITIGNNRKNLGKDNGWEDFEGEIYAEAESKARAYLNGLEDKIMTKPVPPPNRIIREGQL